MPRVRLATLSLVRHISRWTGMTSELIILYFPGVSSSDSGGFSASGMAGVAACARRQNV
eukprot:CAMPEP_0168385158 /NCGR_PEP_ID=MMETSP0228-20121227/14779_1 /TAXON_ID=133427 /ORGANISM="Protoceratium reticulatum, Strain CCCM 535 (=CCMP 1889)" /LENGTH=58 /DNA_ID=CAMNT_0008398341 /DNA_START=155 /DNA_END=331 /DNA_ORIENTATION=+